MLRLLRLCSLLALAACHRPLAAPLPQRGYLWQRAWSPAVSAGAREAQEHLSGLVLLVGELGWKDGQPALAKAEIDWPTVSALRIPCAPALRVAPGAAGHLPPAELLRTARAVLEEARSHGVQPAEFQLDFDCAQKALPAYRAWLRELRPALAPVRLVITALPAWLREPAFAELLRETDGYVLQVHSVPLRETGGPGTLCDPELARAWIARAATLHRPFSVALPTYRCTGGYAPSGRLLSVAMDSVQPAWPPDTRHLEFTSDPTALAALVRELQRDHPPELREILWYRVPIATEERNWRWPTLAAVMSGRPPLRRFAVEYTGAELVDLTLHNTGESDEPFAGSVMVSGSGQPPLALEALRGWSHREEAGRVIFTASAAGASRLPPGGRRAIGWLRYDHPQPLRFELVAPP